MSSCTAQIGLTPKSNTSVPISGTVTWKDGAGSHSQPVNQPFPGGPTTVTLTDVTSVSMTASSPGLNSQTLAVTCGQFTQFELTQLAPPPPPNPTITITGAQAFPARLVSQGQGRALLRSNQINLTWESSVTVIGIDVEITSGGVTKGLNIGGDGANGLSGTVTSFPPNFGSLCEVKIRGVLAGGISFTPFSQSTSIQDPANTHSVRTFFSQSGIDPSKGIRSFMPTTSFRSMMEI